MQESTYFSGFATNVSFSGGLLQHHPKEGLFECGQSTTCFCDVSGGQTMADHVFPIGYGWIYYVALGRRVDFPRTSCLPRRGRSIKPRAMVVPYQGLLDFCGLNQWTNRFICAWKKQWLGWIYHFFFTPWEGSFWVGFTNVFLLFLFLLVVKVASQQIRANKCLEFTRKDHWQKDTVPDLGSRTWISKRWLQEWSPVFFFP